MIAVQSLEEQLQDDNLAVRLGALRQLKNAIIGHNEQKAAYLRDEIVLPVLSMLAEPTECWAQAAVVIGSFAYGDEETVAKFLSYPVLGSIRTALESPQCTSQQASSCLKVLATLLQAQPSLDIAGEFPQLFEIVGTLLCSETISTVEDSCFRLIPLLVLSRPSHEQLATVSEPLINRVYTLMSHYKQHMAAATTRLELALSALSCVVSEHQVKAILNASVWSASRASWDHNHGPLLYDQPPNFSGDEFVVALTKLTKADDDSLRLAAVELLSRLQMYVDSPERKEAITASILPTLIPMIDMLSTDPRYSLTLSYICRDNEKYAIMAAEVGVIKKVMTFLQKARLDSWKDRELVEHNLLLLAGIAIHKSTFRQEITDLGGLGYIVKVLALQPEPGQDMRSLRRVKVAACHALRAMSRSVDMLRTVLASTDMVDGLLYLHSMEADEDAKDAMIDDRQQHRRDIEKNDQLEVQSAIMATICNLILEFTPVQQALLDKGAIDLIVSGTHSSYPPLRLNSIWALRHAIYESTVELKRTVMEKLTTAHLMALCNDELLEIQEQALEFVRNFVCRNCDGVDLLLQEIGEDTWFGLIEQKLDTFEQYPRNVTPAIFILVHIAAGTDAHRDLVLRYEHLLRKLLPLISGENPEIRRVCVWLALNLIWLEEPDQPRIDEAASRRVHKLVELGFVDKLAEQVHDAHFDARERIKAVLFQVGEIIKPEVVVENARK